MYPGTFAAATPDKSAVVMSDTWPTLTYAELEERSIRLAHVLHDAGLRPGDDVALLAENGLHTAPTWNGSCWSSKHKIREEYEVRA